MTHLDAILVGVDGSCASVAAIRFAAHEAQRQGTGIHLVHVVPHYVPITPMLPLVPADLVDTGRQILSDAAETAHKLLEPHQVTTSLLDGPRFRALLQAAEHARLLVIGSERRPPIERLLTGSTLVGVSACPVVAVTRDWSPSTEQHTVVAGVKSTPHSPELVRRALEIAAERRAPVFLVHARVVQRMSRDADLLLVARRHHAFPFGHLGGTARPCSARATVRSRSTRPPTSPGGLPTWCWSKPERSRSRRT